MVVVFYCLLYGVTFWLYPAKIDKMRVRRIHKKGEKRETTVSFREIVDTWNLYT